MTATAAITAQALRLLAAEIQAPDDVPACCLRDAADLIAAQAAEIERVKFEREALVNAAICGQRSLHSDMINRWGDLRDAVLHGLDGLNNDQIDAVLGCIDDHFPSDIKPAATEESSATENRADKAEARVAELERELASLAEHAPPGHPLHSCGGPQEACMQPGCTECGAPTMEEALAMRARVAELERELSLAAQRNAALLSENDAVGAVLRTDSSLAELRGRVAELERELADADALLRSAVDKIAAPDVDDALVEEIERHLAGREGGR